MLEFTIIFTSITAIVTTLGYMIFTTPDDPEQLKYININTYKTFLKCSYIVLTIIVFLFGFYMHSIYL